MVSRRIVDGPLPPAGVSLVLSTQRGQVLVVARVLGQVVVHVLNDRHLDRVGLRHGDWDVLLDVHRDRLLHRIWHRLLYFNGHRLLYRNLHRLVYRDLDAFSHLEVIVVKDKHRAIGEWRCSSRYP